MAKVDDPRPRTYFFLSVPPRLVPAVNMATTVPSDVEYAMVDADHSGSTHGATDTTMQIMMRSGASEDGRPFVEGLGRCSGFTAGLGAWT
jgi:hypothetical protein